MKNWEKEFDEKWSNCNMWSGDFTSGSTGGSPNYDSDKIKQFIASLLSSQLKEVLKFIKALEVEVPECPVGWSWENQDDVNEVFKHIGRTNYNKALDDLKAEVEKLV